MEIQIANLITINFSDKSWILPSDLFTAKDNEADLWQIFSSCHYLPALQP